MFTFKLLNPYSGDPMGPYAVPVDESDPDTVPPNSSDFIKMSNFTLELLQPAAEAPAVSLPATVGSVPEAGFSSTDRQLEKRENLGFGCKRALPRSDPYDRMKQTKRRKPQICDICTENFPTKWLLKSHICFQHGNGESSSSPGPKVHRCTLCQQSFPTKWLLKSHIRFQHGNGESRSSPGPKVHRCTICQQVFRMKWLLEYHVLSDHPQIATSFSLPKTLTCKFCKKMFAHPRRLLSHIQAKHQGGKSDSELNEYECEPCQMVFTKKNMLLEHQQRKHPVGATGIVDAKTCNVIKLVTVDNINLNTCDVLKVGAFNVNGKPWSALKIVRHEDKVSNPNASASAGANPN